MSRATTDKRKQENLPVGHETQTRREKKKKSNSKLFALHANVINAIIMKLTLNMT